jgi:hypothetical protein
MVNGGGANIVDFAGRGRYAFAVQPDKAGAIIIGFFNLYRDKP